MANRLANATSPYLLQHRDNPVDWWEWGEEAFEEARRRDVPVLLSVGYAACHWCHVMAHESFEDPAIAELMNRLFVNIKVDREERPDVDAVYMEATQAMTGHGGWPMTVFIDHDGQPFFAGTYFPKEPRHGMPPFPQILGAISSAWVERREEVLEQSTRLVAAISAEVPAGDLPDQTGLIRAYEAIASVYDPVDGGFGNAPRFPQQPVLDFLLRIHRESWAPRASEMLTHTLERMAAGGIHDHLGGGFARYSVDRRWVVPHFEKMLYDNAQLARIYLWAGIELGRSDFVAVARSTLDYLARDLRHPEGGFYSSEDADSEGVEGKFYVWTVDEVREILGEAADGFISYYGMTEPGNFEGSNILVRTDGSPPKDLEDLRKRLYEARGLRIRPARDDKVVAVWNGLAIRAFAEAGAALAETSLVDRARDAARFLLDNLVVDGQLMRSWRDGRTSGAGFVDDYGAVAVGLYGLYQATGEIDWYRAADAMVGELDRFAREAGGFFTTPADRPGPVKRPFDFTDNPSPSGNALAAEALMYASLFTGDADQRRRFEATLGAAGRFMERHPTMVGHHLCLAHTGRDLRELAIVGPDWPKLAAIHRRSYRPGVAIAVSPTVEDEVPLLAGREPLDGATLAYLCRDFVCDLPTSDPEMLAAMLDRSVDSVG